MKRIFSSILLLLVLSGGVACGGSDFSARDLFGITDDLFGTSPDTATIGVTVTSANGGYCVHENSINGTLSINVVLNKEPTADVELPISTSVPTEAILSVSKLTFTPDDWDTPQAVVVSGVVEGDVDFNKIGSLVFGAAVSEDAGYNGLVPPSVSGLMLIDDDSYSIVACPPAAGLVTTEAGGADTFTVVLSRLPASDVTIPATILSNDLTEATVSPATLTFAAANWFTPQVVTATGVNDTILDGDIAFQVNLPNSSSADPNYNNLQYFSYHQSLQPTPGLTNIVHGVNRDDEAARVVVSPLVLNLNENGPAGTFQVYLTVEPPANSVIPVTSGAPGRATVDTATLTFTPANYNTPQIVTVTPVDNNTRDGVIPPVTIDLGVATNYLNTDPDNVIVNITDNDTAGITVSNLNRNTTEAGQNATFTVVLTSQPSADVTVTLDETDDPLNANNEEGTISHSSLTFTSANWNAPRTVTVTPVNENVMDGNKQWQIAVSNGVSTDPDYSNLAPSQSYVTVNNVDDDVAGFVIVANGNTTQTARSGVIVAGLATDDMNNLDNNTYSRFTIRLRSEPVANVTLNLTSNSTTNDGVLCVNSLLFTPADWNTPQVVTVAGASNGTNEGNKDYQIAITPSTTDDKYSSTTFVAHPAVSIHSCDNDVANVLVGCRRSGGFATSEGGGTATLYFVTQSNPGGNVCIPVVSDDATEGVVTTSPATITTSNWNTMVGGETNRIVVTGQDDGSFDANVLYNLITGSDTCGPYGAFNPPDVPIRNTDDEQALILSGAAGNTSENGTSTTFNIRLGMTPTATVSFTIQCAGGSTECESINGSTGAVNLSFGTDNTDQTITIVGKNDQRVDGTQPSCVQFSALVTSDEVLEGIIPPNACPVNNTDNDRLIYITDSLTVGNYNSGMTAADTFCNDGAETNKPSDIGAATFKALLADNSTRRATTTGTDATGQLAWVLQPSTEYYLKTGSAPYTNRIFTTNSFGFFSFGSLTTALGSPAGDLWTGLNANWTTAADNCSNWTSDSPGVNGRFGVTGATNSTSISSAIGACNTSKRLICVQQ